MEQQPGNRIHMIGNTHFDPVWLWSWDEGMSSIRSTFRSALDRMNEDDEFIYSFSCPPVFEWIRQVDADMFREIQKRVTEGRWYLTEGMWLQPECFTASGESYVRQCLHGQRYLMKYFGRLSETAFNVDSFGHSIMLPQIFKKSGISYCVIGRPDQEDFPLSDPLFRWESPDKSQVMVYHANHLAEAFSVNTDVQIDKVLARIDEFDHDTMVVYGVTNHGGAPTKKAIADSKQKRAESGNRVIFSDSKKFFDMQKEASLEVIRNEIPIRNFGVFSNCSETKKNNRTAEYAVQNAEKAALLNRIVNGESYPAQQLSSCYQDILFNQFHDILGGACIRDAYTDARHLYGRSIQSANEILHMSLQKMTRRMDLRNADAPDTVWNLVVWNLNTFEVNEPMEAEVQWAWEFDWYQGDICVTDEDGNEYVCQLIQPRSIIPGFRSRFVFCAKIPALGYKTFRVRQRASQTQLCAPALTATGHVLESNWLRIELCEETGGIRKIVDKKQNCVLAENCSIPIVLEDKSDTWAFNFTGYGQQDCFTFQSATVLECGELRAKVRTKSTYGLSSLEQDFTIYRDSGMVDGAYRVIWQEHHKTLKLSFHPQLKQPQLTASSPYCAVQRAFDGMEKPVGEWLDISDRTSGTGVTLLWDSIFAYHAQNGDVRATVLRSPIMGDLRMGELDETAEYDYMSQGITTGKWRMIPHQTADVRTIWQESTAFANPSTLVVEANHGGDISATESFLTQGDNAGVWIPVIKQAEDGENVIMRLQNVTENSQAASVSLKKIGSLSAITVSPYEIKTLKWDENGNASEVNMLENESFL